jgi:hypoxanthine phosphoribosyltransferase
MDEIIIKDRKFKKMIGAREIDARLQEVASILRKEHGDEEVVFIIILKGSMFVASDLIRHYGLPCSVEIVRARSYKGMRSSGTVEITMTETQDLRDKTVIIIEDIVETGRTLQAVHFHLKQAHPGRLLTFSLLRKPSAQDNPVVIDYIGFDIDQEFVVGYGLDYDEEGRHLRDIFQLA